MTHVIVNGGGTRLGKMLTFCHPEECCTEWPVNRTEHIRSIGFAGLDFFLSYRHLPVRALAASLMFAVLILFGATTLRAADYYVVGGSETTNGTEMNRSNGNGSASAPWPSVQAAFASGRLAGGDRVLLLPGNHGNLGIRGQNFDPPLTIASAHDGQAHVNRIRVHESSGLIIEGLNVWPPAPVNIVGKKSGDPLVQTTASSSRITFKRLDIRGAPDADTRYLTWGKDDWLHVWRVAGVMLDGPDQTLQDSVLSGISNGITAVGLRARVLDNEVRGFSKDGMRGLGSGSVFRGNTVRDCVKVDGNHDDGFQSWVDRPGKGNRKVVSDVSLIDNVILEWSGPADHPLRCRLQGISLFNGPYRNWIISNNLIAISAYHGIALYGTSNFEVIHNTVVQIDGLPGKSPWIMTKNSTGDASGNLIANNAAMNIKLAPGTATARDNVMIKYPVRIFANVQARDYRPNPDSGLVGAADPSLGEKQDLAGRPRPTQPAVGALEPPS